MDLMAFPRIRHLARCNFLQTLDCLESSTDNGPITPVSSPETATSVLLTKTEPSRPVMRNNIYSMRTLLDIFAQIFRTLWAHKLRSFLTMFGIAWGVGSLLLLVGLGEGFRSGNKRGLSEMGENIMFLYPGRAPAVPGSMASARQYRITYQDYLDIRKEAPHIRAITPVLERED